MTVAQAADIYLAALCVWREMRGESAEARRACLWVIRNRTLDASYRWPRSAAGVVLQKYQFSSFNVADPNAVRLPRQGDTPADVQAWAEISAMCDEPAGDDPTRGSNMYEARADGEEKPGWVASATLIMQIGKTRFYRL